MAKKKERISHNDIIHIFAQGKVTKHIRYSATKKIRIEGKILYYNNLPIGYIYSTRRKIVAIADNFDTSGAYGNGIGSWSVRNSFSDEWTTIDIDIPMSWRITPPTEKDMYIAAITNMTCKYLESVIPYTDILTGDRRNVYTYDNITESNKHINDDIAELHDTFKPRPQILGKSYTETIRWHIPKGWSSISNSKRVTYKIKDLLANGYYTEDELYIINRANWIKKWLYGTAKASTMSKQDKLDMYDDVDARVKWEAGQMAREVIRNREEKAEARRDELRKLGDAKEALVKWLDGYVVNSSLFMVPIHLRIKDDIVQTTRHATVPIAHAKLLFHRFNKLVEANTEWRAKGKSISVGNFNCTVIAKDSSGSWYLIAGCHTIYKTEIDKFINDNNLDW